MVAVIVSLVGRHRLGLLAIVGAMVVAVMVMPGVIVIVVGALGGRQRRADVGSLLGDGGRGR
jgi:hypothetical protein